MFPLTSPLSAVPPFLTASLYLVLGIFVLSHVQAGRKKLAYTLWLFTTVYWQMGWGIVFYLKDPAWMPFIIHITYSGVIFIPIAFYQLFIAFLDAKKDYKWIWPCYSVGAFFAVACWIDHWMIDGILHHPWGFYARAGKFHPFYLLFLAIIVTRILVLLFQRPPDIPAGHTDPAQLNILRWAFILYLPSSFDFAVNYGLPYYPIGFVFTLISLSLVSYAIAKHQLFEIRPIIRKTLIYSMATLSLTTLYVIMLVLITKILEGWVGKPNIYSSAIAAVTIAGMFHPLRSRIKNWVDRYFPRESLNQDILREATSSFVHEIKRPLTNISLPAQLALADVEQAIKNGSELDPLLVKLRERLNYIINQSLDAGNKIEAIRSVAAQLTVKQDPVNLNTVVESVLVREHLRINKERIDVFFDRSVDNTLYTTGDSAQLEIAVGNVIRNAIDELALLKKGLPRYLRIAMKSFEKTIIVEIEDSGIGIDSKHLSRLFDPWFSTKGASGMGIGLYLVKEILRLHSASIEVQSEVGKTTFCLTFRSI